MKTITNYIYDRLPIYIKLPRNRTVAIWNCASRGAIGKKLTFIQNLKEIRITIRATDSGILKRVIKKVFTNKKRNKAITMTTDILLK